MASRKCFPTASSRRLLTLALVFLSMHDGFCVAMSPPVMPHLSFDKPAPPGSDGSVKLEWKDLCYAIQKGSGTNTTCRQILHSMSGMAEPGHVVAIMGPTGSGKTTLLNALAGRVVKTPNTYLGGEILVNGAKRDDNAFRRLSAYVQQDDVLYPHQTVKETLTMAAELRLHPNAQGKTQVDQFVNNLIMQLGLVKAADTIIGDEKVRGVSGGERKRTNLGIEMISDPSVIFLDEPTSGLDSFQAESVVHTLSKLASNGRTVFTSIHQPGSSVYAMFDYLLLLSEGRTIYYGPARDAVAYFSNLGHRCPNLYNPADFFLDLVSIDYRSNEARKNTTKLVKSLATAFQSYTPQAIKGHKMAHKPQHMVPLARMRSLNDLLTLTEDSPTRDERPESPTPSAGVAARRPRGKYATTWIGQFKALLRRSSMEVRRDFASIVVRATTTLIFAAALASIYSKPKIDPQKAIQDKTGALFFMAVNQAFGMIGPVLGSFPMERGVIIRERMAKCYHLSAYYVAKVVSELPVVCALPLFFGAIVYPALRLHRSWTRFATFLVIMVLNSVAATSLGIVVSAATASLREANSVAPVIMVISLLFGGFYVNAMNMPYALRWLSQLSFIRHTFTALALNEFKRLPVPCPPRSWDCVRSGDQVLERLSFDKFNVASVILRQLGLIGAFNALALFFLRRNMPEYLPIVKQPTEPWERVDDPFLNAQDSDED